MQKFFSIITIALLGTVATASECGTQTCIAEHKPCKRSDMDCCGDMSCLGFNFYKTCQEVPECLPEWNDCSQGMNCCGNLVCAETPSGMKECQVEKPDTKTTTLSTSAPTAAPETKNTKTTTPSGGSMYACFSGDPHLKTLDRFR